MKTFITITILIILAGNLFCQRITVKGKLIDYHSGLQVAEATIILGDTAIISGTISDKNGCFMLTAMELEKAHFIAVVGKQNTLFPGNDTSAKYIYVPLMLKNLFLVKKNSEIDLGTLFLVNVNNEDVLSELPCLNLYSEEFPYECIEGSEWFDNGKLMTSSSLSILDFSKPSKTCNLN